MIERISEIRIALSKGLYYCALALALTLPDACGKIEYPNDECGKKRYIKWCNQFLMNQFTCKATVMPDGEMKEYIWLTANEIYALRCAYLHAGNFQVERLTLSKVSLHAHIRNEENYSHMLRDGHYADWDVIAICDNICDSVEKFWIEKSNIVIKTDDIRIDKW